MFWWQNWTPSTSTPSMTSSSDRYKAWTCNNWCNWCSEAAVCISGNTGNMASRMGQHWSPGQNIGYGGDKPHSADPGAHMHVSRNYQHKRKGETEDVLCELRNVKTPFPEQLGFLKRHVLSRRVFLGRYNALSDGNCCPSFLMCMLCSVLQSLCRLIPVT